MVPVRLLFPLAPDSGAEAFVGTDHGVYRTADGGMRWASAGLKDETVLCVGTFPRARAPPEGPAPLMRVAKAHGLGNDFLLVPEAEAPADPAAWARRICERHIGMGADGVLLYADEGGGVRMRLINADGGEAEISANGLRCLAAFRVRAGAVPRRDTRDHRRRPARRSRWSPSAASASAWSPTSARRSSRATASPWTCSRRRRA